MDNTARPKLLHLYKETRAEFENPAGSILQIDASSTSTFTVRQRQHRRIIRNYPVFDTQDAFNKHYLASSASVFSCTSPSFPRSFLWRVVNDQKVLELRSVDLSKNEHEPSDATYAVQLCFNGQLRHGGVALADTDDACVINVFALTKANELYTFAIHKNIFCHASALERDTTRFRIACPATFSISVPHRLVAISDIQLIVSLSDGRLLLLTRKKVDDGSRWNEAVYGDGQWGSSLRGLIRWQGSNTVRYNGATLEQSTPIAMAKSPDERHIFAVCMNHTLRIWNPNKAASIFSKDLLWQQREQHEIPKIMLDPGNLNALQLFQVPGAFEGDLYYAITFSPHDYGQFKFWAIRDPDHGDNGVRDLFPNDLLNAPDPDPSPESKAMWKVVDFKIKSGHDTEQLDLWVLMRSNRQYTLYNLKSILRDLPSLWQNQWTATAMRVDVSEDIPETCESDPEDETQKWLKYLLKPGRYPESLMENALLTYCVSRSMATQDPKLPLSERMYETIRSRVESQASNVDFEKYGVAMHQEWTILWQDIRDFDRSRFGVMSLALSDQADTPWIVFADCCSALRKCTRLEAMVHNSPDVLAVSHEHLEMPSVETETGHEPKLPDELAVIIQAGAALRSSFGKGIQRNLETALSGELWLEPQFEIPLRIQQLYDRCNIADDFAQRLFDDMKKRLEPIGGPACLDRDSFFAIIETFSHIQSDGSSMLSYTKFGVKTLICGAHEMIYQREGILLDLLALAVFVEMEVDQESAAMEYFDGAAIYEALLPLLRQYEVMQWLVSNTRSRPSLEGDLDMRRNNKALKDCKIQEKPTILESVFAVDLKLQASDSTPLSDALTLNIQDLLQWVIGGNYKVTWDEIPVHIQCNLLANKDIDLASDFLRFQPSTAWATYIKARLYLLREETTEAAINFKKAAFKLSRPTKFLYRHASHSLLSPIDAAHLGQGLPAYYTHVVDLFATSNPPFHTQVVHFAHLALQLTPTHPHSAQATDLLKSLLTASLQIKDFTTAYSALTRHPTPSALLPDFISTILATPKALPELLSFPWQPELHTQIDTLLSQHKNPRNLAVWRLHHNDFRGAAAALLPSLQASQARAKRTANDDGGLETEYLIAINLLTCAGKENAWVLSGGIGDGEQKVNRQGPEAKRKIVTVEDVREAYQKELDRKSVIEGGRFAFGGVDAVDVMDID